MISRIGFGVVLAFCSACLFGCGTKGGAHALKPGDAAPLTKLVMLSGETRLLDEFQGTPTVLLFWATNCSASKSRIRQLNEIAVDYVGRARFIAVAIDPSLDAVRSRIKSDSLTNLEHSFSGNDAYDEAFVRFGLDSVPFIYVIDSRGTILSSGDDVDIVDEVL